jgi:phosphate starvation-inducible protein PhoH
MDQLLEKARAYLDDLEANRRAALTLSEQKAEEAKLIQARQEGFQAAIEMLGSQIAAGNDERELQGKEPVRQRGRRPIRDMILRELLFSGQAMTTAQIARAINYIPERTETALERMEEDGQVLRNDGRWTIGATSLTYMNGLADSARKDKSRNPPGA